MEVEILYKIILTQREASPLKRLLGHMTDGQFEAHGIKGDDRKILGALWKSILDDETFD